MNPPKEVWNGFPIVYCMYYNLKFSLPFQHMNLNVVASDKLCPLGYKMFGVPMGFKICDLCGC
jgi:hypothetical protein